MSERFLGTGLSPEEAGQLADRLAADEASDAAILTACYGVTFPSEAERLLQADMTDLSDLGVNDAQLFWFLVYPPARSGPNQRAPMRTQPGLDGQLRAFRRDPDFIPVFDLDDSDYPHGETLVGYRRSALAAGDSRAYGLARNEVDSGSAGPVADCLVDVLLEWLEGGREEVLSKFNFPDLGHHERAEYEEQLKEYTDLIEQVHDWRK